MKIYWEDGTDNYKKHTHIINTETNVHYFNTELSDVPFVPNSSLHEYCHDMLSTRTSKYVDILYSGGLDSELVLVLCLQNKIPVRAVTMRLLVEGYPINTHDLYYSEKFCRENNVEHLLVDLNVKEFFASGRYYEYLKPYRITEPHVATHFWLLEQCDNFCILGGEYSWPWVQRSVITPHRHHYSYYDKFLTDNNLEGIGNFMNHNLGLNVSLIKKHVEIIKSTNMSTNQQAIPIFKKYLWEELNLPSPEIRARSYGWDTLSSMNFNLALFKIKLTEEFGITHSSITWGDQINTIINGSTNSNDKYR